MTNLEFYKDELIDILAEHTSVDRNGKPHTCDSVGCLDCAFSKKKNCQKATKEWLLAEHKEKIKLKQWEYDLLKAVKSHNQAICMFDDSSILKQLVEKGYFKGVAGTKREIEDTLIREVLESAEIVSDDYEGFEECK